MDANGSIAFWKAMGACTEKGFSTESLQAIVDYLKNFQGTMLTEKTLNIQKMAEDPSVTEAMMMDYLRNP